MIRLAFKHALEQFNQRGRNVHGCTDLTDTGLATLLGRPAIVNIIGFQERGVKELAFLLAKQKGQVQADRDHFSVEDAFR